MLLLDSDVLAAVENLFDLCVSWKSCLLVNKVDASFILASSSSPVPFLCNRTDLTREQLLLDLANGRIVLFWMGIAVTTVAVGVLGYALIKYAQTVSQNSPCNFFLFSRTCFGFLGNSFCIDLQNVVFITNTFISKVCNTLLICRKLWSTWLFPHQLKLCDRSAGWLCVNQCNMINVFGLVLLGWVLLLQYPAANSCWQCWPHLHPCILQKLDKMEAATAAEATAGWRKQACSRAFFFYNFSFV